MRLADLRLGRLRDQTLCILPEEIALRNELPGLARKPSQVCAVISETNASIWKGLALQVLPCSKQVRAVPGLLPVDGDLLAASNRQVGQADATQGVPVFVTRDAGHQAWYHILIYRVGLALWRLPKRHAGRGL